ncbi:XRE family transcriptional regulator [Acinetobacter chinensis]|uniref:XRE family transcriptional regulator n=1 Tax=Acinetobacter chinensis TaxID=2004650 RepID=A0A3B7LXY9_9GAMM|nr:helix-turn-helix transcriptional regulator [Acinetobacter chinensis]AXY56834.1 XRE family transcriptional regulator [Acinetobacter chinensis]
MSKLSIELPASAINNASLILKAVNSSNQSKVAEQLGVDASTLSRMKNDKRSNNLTDIELLSGLLSAVGLKVVNANDVYCSPEVAEATRVFLSNSFSSPDYMRILFK